MSRTTTLVSPAPSPTVFVIDDDEDMRSALGNLFRSVGYEVKLFGSTSEFLLDTSGDAPGCLVLDVRLPGMSGLDFQNKLAGVNAAIPIIFMTGHGDIPMSVRAMKAGAVDFLTKPFRDQDMLDAVTRAMDADRTRRSSLQATAGVRENFARLSPREREVMTLVTRGLMNKQVAHELSLSEITVKLYRGQAMRKMGAASLADLVRMAEALALHNKSQ
jgi:FixJ family two-component response regulator